jgi:NAD(P)-dependent dehydrogenase (short-subunit alcohol dehydrogenase family)
VTQRTWFITGTSSGFGREMTKQLLARGDRVAATVRNMDVLNDLKAMYGDLLWMARLDVTDTPAIHEVVNGAFADLGKIDVVISNAGYGLFGAAEEEQILHQINTNLIGSIQVVRAALPHLRQQGGGRIIQLSSVAGQAAFPGGSLYNASKWGIEGFIEATMRDVAPFNISLTIVEPGGARTAFRYGSSKLRPKIAAYDISPVSGVRNMLEAAVAVPPNDPTKIAAAIINSVDQNPAPKRLTLGSDSYRSVHKALSERLAALEAQKGSRLHDGFRAVHLMLWIDLN